MLLITAIVQDRLGRIIKVAVDGVNREAIEIWNIVFSGADTASATCGSDTVPVEAVLTATGLKFLRAAGSSGGSCPLESLPPAPMQMLVFGDSIAWGQGLRLGSKFSTLVGARLQANNRGAPLTITNFANSGAIIGNAPASGTSSGFTITLDSAGENTLGEVPDSTTTVHAQIDAFLATGVDPATIDFILLSAGINDIPLSNILTYLNRSPAITSIVTTGVFFRRMPALLSRMLAVFPNARIIVTTYYPVITASSKPHNLAELGLVIDYLTFKINRPSPGTVFSGTARTNIIGNCATFVTTHLATLTAIVNTINAATPSPFGPRIFIATPAFIPNHALFGPPRVTQLFRLNAVGVSNDPMTAARRPLCNAAYPGPGGDNLACLGASVGHPNVKGALAYSRAIISLL
jgi:lysophospholipase L1-like esterase